MFLLVYCSALYKLNRIFIYYHPLFVTNVYSTIWQPKLARGDVELAGWLFDRQGIYYVFYVRPFIEYSLSPVYNIHSVLENQNWLEAM